jgi:hypothetical protein
VHESNPHNAVQFIQTIYVFDHVIFNWLVMLRKMFFFLRIPELHARGRVSRRSTPASYPRRKK